MARKNLIEKQTNQPAELLNDLITKYAEDKASLDTIKKVCDEENKSIKAIITSLPPISDGKWEHEYNGLKVTVNTTRKQTLNEDKLLDIIESANLDIAGLVKQKSYVDMDVLEDAMYKQLLGHDLMMQIDSCREVKTTQVLTLKHNKED